ncbi:MAG: FecCD family ABC transporter permease [Bacteroidota bacterium]|nr:iron ABC transporter permease [Ignavibacteria bacterium]HEX2962713.1 iron ABC transporter permease [Ignavibacteriales bacterium]MCU7498640.1 iron ABC transporter permease [Ignavibacteria bacterium]MCU7514211.1 iron ABC transporter permease [Ignavibacteria bacterium]MCU7522530.1 iron ABC transporter permease [Ignavibacteria bacterium]
MKIRLYPVKIIFLFIVTLAFGISALLIGSVPVSFKELYSLFLGGTSSDLVRQVIYEVRLPRVLLAIAIGGGLSVSGSVYQAILMNPLAEPYILGISSGAAFGAVLSFLLGLSFLGTQMLAFIGAVSVIVLVFLLGKRFGELEPNIMLLSGVMVGAFFSASILMMTTFLRDSLRNAVFWLMGQLSLADPKSAMVIFPVSVIVSFILSVNSQKFNVLALGSDTASHLGINTPLLKNFTYILTSLMVGMLVSVSGIIGFVGLLVPHVCRMIFGADNRIVIPASFFVGAAYLLVADTLARSIISPAELPVGAITAFIGAPVFVYLLRKRFR